MPIKPSVNHHLVNKKTLIIEFSGSLVEMRKRKKKLPKPENYMFWNSYEKKIGDSVQTISPETLKKIVKNMRKGVDTAEKI